MISRRAARRPIVLHRKQNIESELKWQTFSGRAPSKFSCSSGKELNVKQDTLTYPGRTISFSQPCKATMPAHNLTHFC